MAISNPPEADRLIVLAYSENPRGPDNYRDQLGVYLPNSRQVCKVNALNLLFFIYKTIPQHA